MMAEYWGKPAVADPEYKAEQERKNRQAWERMRVDQTLRANRHKDDRRCVCCGGVGVTHD